MKAYEYAIKRLLLLIPVLLGVSIITFWVSHVVPADPARLILGSHATPEQLEHLREQLGLNKPLYEQYYIFLMDLLRGDLGSSIHTRRPVLDDLLHRFPATLELTTVSMIICLAVGIPLGVVSAVTKDRFPDHLSRIFAVSGVSIPYFLTGLAMLLIFYYYLGWYPGPGRIGALINPPRTITGLYILDSLLTGDWVALESSLSQIILPAICLSYVNMAQITRMVRSSMLEVLSQDYVRTVRAMGLSERRVVYKYALRNALLPTTTLAGLSYGSMLAGTPITETIFSWPGIGFYAVGSMLYLDFPAVMGVTLLIALIYILVNLAVDILYAVIDPRVRY